MDAAIQQIIDLFESLSDAQRTEAALEILSRFLWLLGLLIGRSPP